MLRRRWETSHCVFHAHSLALRRATCTRHSRNIIYGRYSKYFAPMLVECDSPDNRSTRYPPWPFACRMQLPKDLTYSNA
jgi:hypothetical protein